MVKEQKDASYEDPSSDSLNSNGQSVQKRNVIISTDGVKFEITQIDISLLELREICRQILQKTGGP
jgi:hypothetical protein